MTDETRRPDGADGPEDQGRPADGAHSSDAGQGGHPKEGHPHHGRPDDGGASVEPGGTDEFDTFVEHQLSDIEDTVAAEEAMAAAEAESGVGGPSQAEHPDTRLAAERLSDLQRLQAEYVNYKKRVDRDRDVAKERGVDGVLDTLLPVLDDIHAARLHGDLAEGPFAAIADKLEKTLAKFGFERYGDIGEPFDPTIHEALMHLPDAEVPEGATETTVVQVLMPGYRRGEHILRAARVAVADPR